jgi:hypothetical protein
MIGSSHWEAGGLGIADGIEGVGNVAGAASEMAFGAAEVDGLD